MQYPNLMMGQMEGEQLVKLEQLIIKEFGQLAS